MFYLLISYSSKMFPIYTIAKYTVMGFARDKIFYTAIIFAVLFVSAATSLSSLSILEQEKLLIDFGVAAISISGILMAIFTGIVSVAKEIESKTIYTILSKPISRMVYLLGKALGCIAILIVTEIIMASTLLALLFFNEIAIPNGLLACFYLMLLESVIIFILALFFSCVLNSSILAGSMTLITFIVGRSNHILSSLTQKKEGGFSGAIYQLLYYIFPNLNRFDIRALVSYSKPYPEDLLLVSSTYFAAYV